MKNVSKALLGTIAAGAMVASSATPAYADHLDNNRNGISVGDIIAGALIIGGIAVVASAASRNNGRDYRDGRDYRNSNDGYGYDRNGDDDNYNGGYNNGGYTNGGYNNGYDQDARWRANPRQAVEQCIYAAERYAASRGVRADVTDIREVKDTRYGFQVKGRIAIQGRNNGWHRGDNNYGQGWGGDYRGWNSNVRGYDSGSFKCKFERGRITDLDINGVRGF